MFGLLRMVAWTTTAIAMLLLFTAIDARAQESTAVRDDKIRTDEEAAERSVADRYEKILRSRPQIGVAFDKLYEFHSRQGTIAELCERIESSANERDDGNAFQLLGLLQLRRGLLEEAINNLSRAELLLPDEPLASLYRSRALSLNRQYGLALSALENAVNRKPTQAVALEILRELIQLRGREIDTDVAVELMFNLDRQFSGSSQVSEKLADCLIELGRPESAQPVYEKLIELTRDPLKRIELRMRLAGLKKRLGDPEQALSDLQQMVTQVKPQSWLHTSLLEQIEQLTEELHGTEGLTAYYEGMLLKQPEDVETILRLAKLLRNQARFDQAKGWISKAIELSPTQPEPLLAMVDLMEDSNQIKDAAAVMQQLVQLNPSNPDYIVRWGQLVAREAHADSLANAAAIWQTLRVGHENDPIKAVQVADLLQSISLQDEAVKMYEHAVKVSEGKVEYTELLGEYLLKIDRREDARKVFESTLSVAGDRETLMRFSETLKRLRFPVEALRAIEKACAIGAKFGDLIQLANLQRENEHFEAALETANRASKLAEKATDWTQVWDLQAKTYSRARQLPESILALEKRVKGSETSSVELLQQLATMRSANQQPAAAAAAALEATLVEPDSIRTWLLAAQMQKDAGLSLPEIESLHALCKLDTKHAADYLQRIAAIQFQLNQVDQSLATMEKIFATSSANMQHFQLAASFCVQAKKVGLAVELLHRATQVFPRDRSAWLILARQLFELKENAKAIDATWHVLELSRDDEQQREAVDLLVSLHQSEPSVASLLAGLDQFGIEHKQEGKTDLWSAWVLLAGRDRQRSSQLIAKILDRANAKPESLQVAMELAVRDSDFMQAAAIQKRLFRENATAANQLKLGQLLWQSGDSQAAASEWKNILRLRSNDMQVTEFARELAARGNWMVVAGLVQVGVEMKLADWEFLALGVYANIQIQKLSEAARLSEQLLAMNLPLIAMKRSSTTTSIEESSVPPTAIDRLAWIEHAGEWQSSLNVVSATRAGYRTNQTNPRALQAAAVRQLALQRGAALRSNQSARFNVQCFAEARALAVLVKYGKVNQQRNGTANDLEAYVADAINSKNVAKLWDCVLVMEPASSSEVLFTSTGAIESNADRYSAAGRYRDVLDALLALNEPAAVEFAINEMVQRRQLQHQIADRFGREVPAMELNEIDKLQKLVQSVEADVARFAGQITLAIELVRLKRGDESRNILEIALGGVSDVLRLATSARQFLSHDIATLNVVEEMLLRAFELELETSSESNDLAFAISSFRSTRRFVDSKSQGMLIEMIRRQAMHVEHLSRELIFSDSRSNESRRAYRSFRKPMIVSPDRSSLISTSLRATLFDSTTDELNGLVAELITQESLTQIERTIGYFVASIAKAVLKEPDSAFDLIARAKSQQVAPEIISLYEVWLLVAQEKYAEGRDLVNRIEPSNEAIQRECELWKMDLGIKLGDRGEAQRAARALAKLPLSVHENADVAAVLSK